MRGVSGAGKSTYVKTHFPKAFICSADSFFYNEKGEYLFNPNLLGRAHETCRKKFAKALKNKEPLIVVDNTNTRFWEMKPYINATREVGYKLKFIRLEIPVEVATGRNLHNVPEEAIRKMASRMQELPGELSKLEIVVNGEN